MPKVIHPYWTTNGVFIQHVILAAEISNGAKICYVALASFASKETHTCFPGQDTLAAVYNSIERRTRDHLKELEEAGLIRAIKRGQGKTNEYEFLSLEDWVPVKTGQKQPVRTRPDENDRSGSVENDRLDRTKMTGLELLKTVKNASPILTEQLPDEQLPDEQLPDLTNTPFAASSFPASQETPPGTSPPDPQAPKPSETVFADAKTTNVPSRDEEHVYDIGEGLSTENFILKAYKVNRGRKTTKTEIKHDMRQIQEAITASGDAEFRTGLLKYLDRDDEWVRARHWPLWGFLKNPSSYTRGLVIASASATATQATGTGKVSSQPAANAPEPISEPLPTVEYYVQNWNQSVPQEPCDGISPRQREIVTKTIGNPEFRAGWPKITKICALITQNPEWDNKEFVWLFLADGKLGCPNWQAVLDGKWSFAAKKPAGVKTSMSSSDAALAELRAERLAKEAQARA